MRAHWETWKEFYSVNRQWVLLLLAMLASNIVWMFSIEMIAKKTLFVVILIAAMWVFEIIPLSVTALIPLAFFPFLNVLSADEVAQAYFNDTIVLFIGGFFLAIAMEDWNLHKRLALMLLIKVGKRPRFLLFCFMLATFLLSMWMSNTATAALMIPLAMISSNQLINSIKQRATAAKTKEQQTTNPESQKVELTSLEEPETEQLNVEIELSMETETAIKSAIDFSKALLLGVAYSSSIGGTATIIGTGFQRIFCFIFLTKKHFAFISLTNYAQTKGTNLVFKAQFKILFPHAPEISFSDWFISQCPLALIVLIITWMVNKQISQKGNSNTNRNESTNLIECRTTQFRFTLSIFLLHNVTNLNIQYN